MVQSLVQEPVNKLKGLVLVAHPDDCVIFARPFIQHHTEYDWDICYLTYKLPDKRAIEAYRYWTQYKIHCTFLGYIDDDMVINDEAEHRIQTIAKDYDLILTHNKNGEYGHAHHMFIHNSIINIPVTKVFFANNIEHNITYTETEKLDLTFWNEHKNAIAEWGTSPRNYWVSNS